MSNVKLNERSWRAFTDNLKNERVAAAKQLVEDFRKGKAEIPILTKRIADLSDETMKKYDKEITEIIKKRTSKIKYKSKKKVIRSNDIKRTIKSNKVGYFDRGELHGELKEEQIRYTGDYGDKHKYVFKHHLKSSRSILYWFGDIPNYDDWDHIKESNRKAFPLYCSNQYSDMYQPSKYSVKYPDYVYMPYIVSVQPAAKDFVYWYGTTPIGTYSRDTYVPGMRTPVHRKGDPKYPRYRSTGERVGEKVCYTWYNRADKDFVPDIVDEINRRIKPIKNGKMHTIRIPKKEVGRDNPVGRRSSDMVDVKYSVTVKAKVGAGFERKGK